MAIITRLSSQTLQLNQRAAPETHEKIGIRGVISYFAKLPHDEQRSFALRSFEHLQSMRLANHPLSSSTVKRELATFMSLFDQLDDLKKKEVVMLIYSEAQLRRDEGEAETGLLLRLYKMNLQILHLFERMNTAGAESAAQKTRLDRMNAFLKTQESQLARQDSQLDELEKNISTQREQIRTLTRLVESAIKAQQTFSPSSLKFSIQKFAQMISANQLQGFDETWNRVKRSPPAYILQAGLSIAVLMQSRGFFFAKSLTG